MIMRFIEVLSLLLLISAFSSIEAEENTKKPAEVNAKPAEISGKKEKIPDFSKGFAMFHELGVPDVSKAKYIKIDDQRGYNWDLSGNGWLIKTNNDNSFTVFKDNVKCRFYNPEKIEKQKAEKLEKLYKELKNNEKELAVAQGQLELEYSKIRCATYREADLKKDIVLFNKKLAELKNMTNDIFSSGLTQSGVGKVFIFAINLYDKGYKSEANKIANTLFKDNGKKAVIISVINQLANDTYMGIYEDFMRTRDWNSYSSQLDNLIKRMPEAWNKKPVMKLLAERIKERISGKVPKLNSKELSAGQKEMAKKLVKVKSLNEYTFWLLPSSKEEGYETISCKENEAIDEIIVDGVKSIPLLIALLKDNCLTDLTNYSSYEYGIFGEEENDGSLEKAYKKMVLRPLSSGEIAKRLLDLVLIEKNSYSDEEGDDTAARALDLYELLKNKNKEEIAEYYLKNGSQYNHKPAAVRYLCKTKNPKYIAMAEKYFIDNAGLDLHYEVTQYLEIRGPAAKDFVGKYLKALKSSLDIRLKREVSYLKNEKQLAAARKRLDKEYEKTVKDFEKYISSETAEQLLAKITKQEKWDNDNYGDLQFKCKGITFDKLVPLLLKSTIAAENSEVKYRLLELINRFHRYQYGAEKAKYLKDFKSTKSLWLKLIADKPPIMDSTDYTVGKYVLFIIEMISEEEMSPEKEKLLRMLPEARCLSLLKKRALARIDGKSEAELPPLPMASKVSDAEYRKTVTELDKTPVAQLAGKIEKLSDNMFLKLSEEIDKDQALNKKLLVIANKITKVNNTIKDKKIVELLPQIKGSLNEKVVRMVLTSLKGMKFEKQYVFCRITVNAGLDGVTVSFGLSDIPDYAYNRRQVLSDRSDYVSGLLATNQDYINCSWQVEKEKKSEKTQKNSEDEDENLFAEAEADFDEDLSNEMANKNKEFWEGVNKFENRTNAMQGGFIYFKYNQR